MQSVLADFSSGFGTFASQLWRPAHHLSANMRTSFVQPMNSFSSIQRVVSMRPNDADDGTITSAVEHCMLSPSPGHVCIRAESDVRHGKEYYENVNLLCKSDAETDQNGSYINAYSLYEIEQYSNCTTQDILTCIYIYYMYIFLKIFYFLGLMHVKSCFSSHFLSYAFQKHIL